jgi:hypothetical protein
VLEILSACLLLLLGIGVVTRLYMLFFPTANADGRVVSRGWWKFEGGVISG